MLRQCTAMAAQMMSSMMQRVAASHPVARPAMASRLPAPWVPCRMLASAANRVNAVPEVPVELDDDEDLMADQPVYLQRRVLKLKEIQQSYDGVNQEYQKELAVLQAKYLDKYKPFFDLRREVISGAAPVEKYDIPDDGEKDQAIGDFWLTAFYNHDKIGPYITDRDAEVLKHLTDVRYNILTEGERGFELTFHFSENKYFRNQTLTKRYELEPEDDFVPKRFVGCKIDWKSDAVNTTVEQKKKRVKNKGGDKKKGGQPAFTIETEPCESFFNIFDPPEIPSNPEEMDGAELDALQEELTADFDIGFAVKDQVIPRAVEWYTGELASFGDDMYDEDEMDYEDEEFEEPEEPEPPMRGGKGQRR